MELTSEHGDVKTHRSILEITLNIYIYINIIIYIYIIGSTIIEEYIMVYIYIYCAPQLWYTGGRSITPFG